MKKTLVALAALAATGASFAQVTISGNLTAGYQQNVTNTYTGSAAANTRVATQNQTSGFGVDTADVNFIAVEDLGGGQKVQARMGLTAMVRGASATTSTGAFGPADAVLTYTNNSFGQIEFGTILAASLFSGTPTAGAPTINFDDKLFLRRATSEYVSYGIKAGSIGGQLVYGEDTAAPGLGAGSAGAPADVKQRSLKLAAGYADSGLSLAGAYITYDNPNETTIFGAQGLAKTNTIGLEAGYDAGVAKFGLGYQTTKTSVGVTLTDMLVGVNVPVGALDVGLTWGQGSVSGIPGVLASALTHPNPLLGAQKNNMLPAEGTANGWSLGARYNLSKRTSFTVNTAQWTKAGYPQFQAAAADNFNAKYFGYGPIESQTNILLSHSF